jgi:hypothetical protein
MTLLQRKPTKFQQSSQGPNPTLNPTQGMNLTLNLIDNEINFQDFSQSFMSILSHHPMIINLDDLDFTTMVKGIK